MADSGLPVQDPLIPRATSKRQHSLRVRAGAASKHVLAIVENKLISFLFFSKCLNRPQTY